MSATIREEFEKAFNYTWENSSCLDERSASALWAARWALEYRGDELSKKLAKELQ